MAERQKRRQSGSVLFFLFYYLLFFYFFNVVLTWKNVEASKASVFYIYIDEET